MSGSLLAAMDYASDGLLYAMDGDGSIYLVNDATGETTFVSDTGDDFWLGMAANPVPEPATFLVLGVGAALLIGRARRK